MAEAVLVAVAGFACGFVNSIAGGGSLILFPALMATGMGSVAANVTNSVATLPGYLGGAFGFRAELSTRSQRMRPLVVAAVGGSMIGSWLLLITPESAFDIVVPLLVAVGAVLIALQPVVRRRVGTDGGRSMTAAVIGVLAATIYGGYFGGGLGVILVAILGLTIPQPLRVLNAVKTVLSAVCAAVTVAIFGVFGPVHWWWVLLASPLAAAGGYVGSRVARRTDEDALRTVVVVFGLLVAAALALT